MDSANDVDRGQRRLSLSALMSVAVNCWLEPLSVLLSHASYEESLFLADDQNSNTARSAMANNG